MLRLSAQHDVKKSVSLSKEVVAATRLGEAPSRSREQQLPSFDFYLLIFAFI
jgi:hypothetical protein